MQTLKMLVTEYRNCNVPVRSINEKRDVLGIYATWTVAQKAAEAFIKKNPGKWHMYDNGCFWGMSTFFNEYTLRIVEVELNADINGLASLCE